MNEFNVSSRRSYHYGINYIVTKAWIQNPKKVLTFQSSLLDKKIDCLKSESNKNFLELSRTEESSLRIRIASVGPDISNILVISERPTSDLDYFIQEAEAVFDAYYETFIENKPCQIVRCDATLRHLYSCKEHAFKYLWETRLGQEEADFKYLGGRPILGGGLRLVLPPVPQKTEPVNIEIKIESFLGSTRDMYIETQFVWPQPKLLQPNERFNPGSYLHSVEQFATNEVCNFIIKPDMEE